MKPHPKAIIALTLIITIALAHPPRPHATLAADHLWPDHWQVDSSFYQVWSRTDEPVAAGTAIRSWLWGPTPFAVANEDYAESATGKRLVQYFDKGRMEINDPSADRASSWFVSSGLLVNEMVSGQMQTGNSRFEQRPLADVPVAGDSGNKDAPRYAAFAQHTGPAPNLQDQLADVTIVADGATAPFAWGTIPADPKLFGLVAYDDLTKHNVPAVFRDWTLQTGTVLEGVKFVEGPLMDPIYVLGRPITEPYWATVPVDGKPTPVLIQLFERRALTYNPNNPPAWRVEMANVGRAYYDWRYGSHQPEPAISAEAGRDGLRVSGWNWPANATIQVEIALPGNPTPISGPHNPKTDAKGYFTALIPPTNELAGALQANANLQVKAVGQGKTAALPFAGKAFGGPVTVEGVIAQASSRAPQYILRARDGQEWILQITANRAIRYSEGDAAPPQAISAGGAATVYGNALGSNITVSEITLLSASRTGAKLGYAIQPNAQSVRVSGTGWPAGKQVTFGFAALNSEGGPQAGKVRVDSRGNLTVLLPLPNTNTLPADRAWLFATAIDNDRLLAQVALPLADQKTPITELPQLFALTQAGEQQGLVGDYCWRSYCSPSVGGLPISVYTLPAKAGEVVTFRVQHSPNPTNSLSPTAFSIKVYAYNATPETPKRDSKLYFTPTSQPIVSATSPSGKAFNITLPQSLAPGEYILQVQVTWPDPNGGKSDAVYGFHLQTP